MRKNAWVSRLVLVLVLVLDSDEYPIEDEDEYEDEDELTPGPRSSPEISRSQPPPTAYFASAASIAFCNSAESGSVSER